ncbi:MAG: methylmalonyl Co-A mutase-associated GTPase MeaB [Thaumarchaeota archaeon]|nr:methylmalonyl Co-A mutase-associated GTPase MeaB [Nitrososphaerota archaeon]
MSNNMISSILSGDRAFIARAISMIENEDPEINDIMSKLYSKTGNAFVIGITGPPGTGKSTLINQLISSFRKLNKKVGVIAIDPSSPISGGSLLGDRLRMQDHGSDSGVYIRSMASGNRSGGLAKATRRSISVLDASGFDVIIVESVGAGQSEVDILKITDTVVIVLMPELGDDIQMYKAGLMEIGDIFVINKSDLKGSDKMYTRLLAYIGSNENNNWSPNVIQTISTDGTGISNLLKSILARKEFITNSLNHPSYKKNKIKNQILDIMIENLKTSFLQEVNNDINLDSLVDEVYKNEIDPEQAAAVLKTKLDS